MIKTIIAKAGQSPTLDGVIIEENICQGFSSDTTPTAVVTVAKDGEPVVAGDVTLQDLIFAVTVTYQPCGMSSETRVRTFAERVTVALPGVYTTITPSVGQVVVEPEKVCNGRARGVKVLTSLSVTFAA